MTDDPLEFLNDGVDIARVDANAILRDLLDVEKVALGPEMSEPSSEEAKDLLQALLTTVERAMPPDLQAQDPRVREAQILWQIISQ
ncbi:MAG: hypothetical protein ABIY37_14765 [Devosia sp.]